MSKSSLTEHALATIASILDYSHHNRGSEPPATASPPIAPVDVDGYTKIGPGPMEAIRFKWTVRRGDDGAYFVEERMGENPPSAVTGPMSREDAVKLVDDRESNARQRFEQIRSEIIGRGAALDVMRRGGEG